MKMLKPICTLLIMFFSIIGFIYGNHVGSIPIDDLQFDVQYYLRASSQSSDNVKPIQLYNIRDYIDYKLKDWIKISETKVSHAANNSSRETVKVFKTEKDFNIGGIAIGDRIEDAINQVGTYESSEISDKRIAYYCSQNGHRISFDEMQGHIVSIHTKDKGIVTSEGIGVGSNMSDVIKVYGKYSNENVQTYGDESLVDYPIKLDKNRRCYMRFVVNADDGKITEIYANYYDGNISEKTTMPTIPYINPNSSEKGDEINYPTTTVKLNH